MKNKELQTAAIFGMGGQDSIYLSKLLLSKGYKVIGVARRSSQPRNNLVELITEGLKVVEGDVTDTHSVDTVIREYKPNLCFNLAAMSHVHTSFNSPHSTFGINTLGVLNILEVIKNISPETRLYHASTSEMFGSNYSMIREDGEVEHFDIKKVKPNTLSTNKYLTFPFQYENTPFDSQSPYSTSKIAAHQLVKLYRESYGLFACSGILFNHESPHRGENFVTRKITRYVGRLVTTLDKSSNQSFPKLQLGNLDSYRDWSHAEDLVKAMLLMLEADTPKDYVIGSGSTHSIKEFLHLAFSRAGLNWKDWVEINPEFLRPAEVDYLCSKPDKAIEELGWNPTHTFEDLVYCMVDSDIALAKKE